MKVKKLERMQISKNGVFKVLLNEKAFLDKVVVGVKGIRKDQPSSSVKIGSNVAIGGFGRNYARKESGLVTASGNSFDLVYGPSKLIAILPPMMLTLRSDDAPITVKELTKAIDAICEEKWKASISSLELTFDFSGLPIEFFRRSIFSTAHRYVSIRDEKG
jgi:hypothetical protein